MTSVLKANSSTNWADQDDHDLPTTPEVHEQADGTIVIVEYRNNEDGQQVKVTRKLKKRLVGMTRNPAVVERKSLSKFGAERSSGPGPNSATTSFGEIVQLRLQQSYRDSVADEEENARKKLQKSSTIKCRLCSGNHWTNKCPNANAEQISNLLKPEGRMDGDEGLGGSGLGSRGTGKWVSASLQTAMANQQNGLMPEREEMPTLKVSNLSSEATEQDLGDLMSSVGKVIRVNIPKRKTGEPRGFAYVSFDTKTTMQAALSKFQGFKYDHLVLHLEIAERRKN